MDSSWIYKEEKKEETIHPTDRGEAVTEADVNVFSVHNVLLRERKWLPTFTSLLSTTTDSWKAVLFLCHFSPSDPLPWLSSANQGSQCGGMDVVKSGQGQCFCWSGGTRITVPSSKPTKEAVRRVQLTDWLADCTVLLAFSLLAAHLCLSAPFLQRRALNRQGVPLNRNRAVSAALPTSAPLACWLPFAPSMVNPSAYFCKNQFKSTGM